MHVGGRTGGRGGGGGRGLRRARKREWQTVVAVWMSGVGGVAVGERGMPRKLAEREGARGNSRVIIDEKW